MAETNSKIVATVMKALDFAYEKAIDGVPGVRGVPLFDSAEALADDYRAKSKDVDAAIERLIKFQATKASVAGAVTGFGGAVTMAVALPANLVTVLAIQLRMIAAIARLRGYDIRSDQVRSLAFVCLVGDAVWESVKEGGLRLAVTMARKQAAKVPATALLALNRAVGLRLATKAGSKGIFNVSRLVPLVGGVVGGALDGGATLLIASRAKATFTPGDAPKPKAARKTAKKTAKKIAKERSAAKRVPRQKAG